MTILEDPPETDVGRRFHEPLTEAEKCLVAILRDRSGLDLAEFTVHDHARPDGCWRAYPYQWQWWRCPDARQVDQTGRSTGKSEGMMARGCAFPFSFPGQSMVIVAPEGIHLDAITDRIEARIRDTRLMSEMIISGRNGITHRPFKVVFANGALVYTRLPQRSGIGVKAIHPAVLEVDEAQDISDRTYMELPEVIRWDIPGASWRLHGVSKGIRGDGFWRSTQEGSGFTVHRLTGMHKPTWNEAEREQKILEYGGSIDSPDFKRNVYGVHGDSMNRIFILTRLMAAVDTDEGSAYNVDDYAMRDVTADELAARMRDDGGGDEIALSTDAQADVLIGMLDLPEQPVSRYDVFWAGMDVGLVADPSEVLIAAEYTPDGRERQTDKRNEIAVPDPGISRLKLLTRIRLRQLPTPLQVELILFLIDFYRPRAFTLDRTGIGLPLFQALQQRAGTSRFMIVDDGEDPAAVATAVAERSKAKQALTVIKGYGFSQKIPVEIDEAKALELGPVSPREVVEKAGIFRNAKDAATDELRTLVDTSRWLLPFDMEVINQMNGQTWQYSVDPVDAYGKRRLSYSTGTFHILDALRMLALGRAQQPMEELLSVPAVQSAPVIDYFGL